MTFPADKIIDFLIDTLTLAVFFRSVRSVSDAKKILIGMLFVVFPIPLYFAVDLKINVFLRSGLRIISAAVFLYFIKNVSVRHALYHAIQFTCYMIAFQSIRPYLGSMLGIKNIILLNAIYDVLQLLIAFIISFLIPFSKVETTSVLQWVILAFLFILVNYSKTISGANMRIEGPVLSEFSAYPMLIMLLSLVLLVLYDRLFIAIQESNRQEMLALGATYQYNNLKDKLAAQDNVNKVYHDMKNHLLALRSMDAHSEEKTVYIDSLLDEIDLAKGGIDTGLPMLNGFMHEKYQKAQQKGIQMGVCLDATPLSDMDPVDLCCMIGNALDNAIEAAEKIPQEGNRFINVRSSLFANQLILNISNSFNGDELVLGENGLPKTTKKDSLHHGFGTRSILEAVKKYNGTLSFTKPDSNTFSLTIMLPLQ